jgi:HEPN domain-containing protein
VTNHERGARLLSGARRTAAEMVEAIAAGDWNQAARRAQEVVELASKALLNEMGIDVPKIHDPAPLLARVLSERRIFTDEAFLAWLTALSARLADLRSPAFYQEIVVSEAEARAGVEGAHRILEFIEDLMRRLARPDAPDR